MFSHDYTYTDSRGRSFGLNGNMRIAKMKIDDKYTEIEHKEIVAMIRKTMKENDFPESKFVFHNNPEKTLDQSETVIIFCANSLIASKDFESLKRTWRGICLYCENQVQKRLTTLKDSLKNKHEYNTAIRIQEHGKHSETKKSD